MKKGIIITGSILAVSAIAYVIYKKSVPPRLTVRTYSPVTGEGLFEWGKARGNLVGSGGFSAGWGWTGEIKPGKSNEEKIFIVSKNGIPRASATIDHSGIYKL